VTAMSHASLSSIKRKRNSKEKKYKIKKKKKEKSFFFFKSTIYNVGHNGRCSNYLVATIH